jgi:hypothetical protein
MAAEAETAGEARDTYEAVTAEIDRILRLR